MAAPLRLNSTMYSHSVASMAAPPRRTSTVCSYGTPFAVGGCIGLWGAHGSCVCERPDKKMSAFVGNLTVLVKPVSGHQLSCPGT
jgi:hypothetical protein